MGRLALGLVLLAFLCVMGTFVAYTIGDSAVKTYKLELAQEDQRVTSALDQFGESNKEQYDAELQRNGFMAQLRANSARLSDAARNPPQQNGQVCVREGDPCPVSCTL